MIFTPSSLGAASPAILRRETAKSGLNLTSYEGLMAGTKQGGALIEPGHSTSSTFMVMITRKDYLRMPYGAAPLSDDELRVIRTWIDQGAKNN